MFLLVNEVNSLGAASRLVLDRVQITVLGQDLESPSHLLRVGEILPSYDCLQQPGEPDLVIKLIDLFINGSAARFAALKEAVSNGDMDEIRRQAHAIRGSSGNVGARLMVELSTQLEKSVGIKNAEESTATLETAFRAASESLISIRTQRQRGDIK